jgi:hypothetical protein
MAEVRKRVALPLVGSDIFQVIRPSQNSSQLLDVTLSELYSFITAQFGGGGVTSVNGQTGVVVLALDDISDVNTPSPTAGQILQWNGTNWISATVGAAAWGSIGTGSGVGSQADLVAYLLANYQPIGSYVPTTRTITINGLPQDLSANRSWSVGTVTAVTATGPIASSGGTAPVISTSMATNKLIGRGTAGTGVMEEITLGTGLSLSGNTLNATGGGVSPLTTKGDLYTFDTADTRLPVGLPTQVLLADPSTATGLKWGNNTTPPASGYYFAISDSTTQDNPTANTPRAVKFNTVDLFNGFSLQTQTAVFTGTINNGGAGAGTILNVTSVTSGTLKVGMVLTGASITAGTFISAFTSGTGGTGTYVVSISQNRTSATYTGTMTSQIVVANTGIYNIQFSSQMDKTGGGVDYVNFWLRRNGVDVTASAGVVSLQGNAPAYMMAAWNYLIELIAGDIIELYWGSADTSMSILSEVAQTSPLAHPAVQSTILTITQQAGILAGTGITGLGKSGFIQTGSVQTLVEGASGTDFNIVSSANTQTFNLPTASATNRGALSSADWSTFNGKFNTPSGTTAQYVRGDGSLATFPAIGVGTVTNVSASVPSPASPALSVTVVNPTSTPNIQITALGTTNEYVRGDGSRSPFPSILLGGGKFAWMTELYDHTQATLNAIEYVAAVDKLYIAAGSNNVVIYNATTGQLLSTIALTAALKVKYIASINEIWITSVSVASITRVNPTTNAVIGTITTGVVANGIDILEYSSTKVFVTIISNPGRILEVNPITFLVTSITLNVPVFPSGMVLNTNVLSAQFDKIIITASVGIAILTPTTSLITTTVTNPSSSINQGRDIIYSTSDDKYYLASQNNHCLICLNIDSATTFSVNRIKYNCYQIISFANDEDNDLLIVNQTGSLATNLNTMCNFIKRSTFDSMTNVNTPSAGGGNSQSGYLKLDVLNKRVFVAGRSTGSRNVVTVKYL